MLEPESQDPAQGAASYRVQPPLGLPPLLSHPKYPQSPTRPPSCHAEYLEPGGLHSSTSVLSPGDSFRWPRPKWGCHVNIGSLTMERQPTYMFTEPFGGSEAMPCLENLGNPLWGSDLLLLPLVCSQAQLPALMIRVLIALAYEQHIAGSRCLVTISQGLGTATPPATLCNSWSTYQDRSHDGAAGQEPGPALLSGEALCP